MMGAGNWGFIDFVANLIANFVEIPMDESTKLTTRFTTKGFGIWGRRLRPITEHEHEGLSHYPVDTTFDVLGELLNDDNQGWLSYPDYRLLITDHRLPSSPLTK